MKTVKVFMFVLPLAAVIALSAGCGGTGRDANTETTLSGTETTQTEASVTTTVTTAAETTAVETAPDGELEYDYINVLFEGTDDIVRDDSEVDTAVAETREELLAFYDDYELGIKKKVKDYFNDAFFEKYTVIVITTSKHNGDIYNEISRVERENGIISIDAKETCLDYLNYYVIVYRYQSLIILDKSDYNGEEVKVNLTSETKSHKEMGMLAGEDYKRSLEKLEKYKP